MEKLAVEKLLRKLIRTQSRTPRVMVTDKPGSDGAARTGMGLNVEHRQHKGLNNRAEKPGKECASADAAAQEDHQAVHIRPAPEAPRRYPRSGRQPPQLSPPRHVVIRRSDAASRAMVAWREIAEPGIAG